MRCFVITLVLCSITLPLTAAPMVRVIGVLDARTLTVDRHGVAATVRLAGIAIPPFEEEEAAAFLRRTVESTWVLVEPAADGASWVFRSPDGLYVNGEVARRAYAVPHHAMTYLGQSAPGAVSGTSSSRSSARASEPPRARPAPQLRLPTIRITDKPRHGAKTAKK